MYSYYLFIKAFIMKDGILFSSGVVFIQSTNDKICYNSEGMSACVSGRLIQPGINDVMHVRDFTFLKKDIVAFFKAENS